MEHLVPSLSDLKVQICSTDMSEACFWKIYFVLLHSKLNKQDAELLSTPQVVSCIIHSIYHVFGTLFLIYYGFCAMYVVMNGVLLTELMGHLATPGYMPITIKL